MTSLEVKIFLETRTGLLIQPKNPVKSITTSLVLTSVSGG